MIHIWSHCDSSETHIRSIYNSPCDSPETHRLAIHLSQNTRKQSQNAKNEKCIARYFASLFSLFAFRSISRQSQHLRENSEGFYGLFFRGINKTWNSHEIRKVYSECFVFRGVFRKNICEIPAKCEIRKVYNRPYVTMFDPHVTYLWSIPNATCEAYKHSPVENSTIYRNRSSDWSIWLVMCRLYGRVAAEAKSDNVNASAVVRKQVW